MYIGLLWSIGEVYFGCPIWGAMEENSAIYDSCSPKEGSHIR